MKIALAQIDVRVGDFARNLDAALATARAAAERGAALVAFPELTLVGYPPRDLLRDGRFVAAAIDAQERLAVATRDLPALVIGGIQYAAGAPAGHPGLHDAALVLAGGRIVAATAKRLLPSYDVFHETRWFVPGRRSVPVEVAGAKLGLLVCEDLWCEGYDVDPGAELARAGAELLVCVSASPFTPGVRKERLRLARRHALPVIYVNAVGATDEVIFDGGSFVADAHGRLVKSLPRFEEALEVVDLAAPAGPVRDPPIDRPEDTFGALVLGVRDFARKNGIRPAMLGLSGGIDSALVAVIAVEALGRGHVQALALPSRFTDPRSTAAARELAATLGIRLEVISIEPLHAAALAELEPRLGPAEGEDAVWAENVQARVRALLLLAHVNRAGGLLLNTTNKSELALGYGTLHGDLAGTVSVLGDVTKTQVFAIARWLQAERAVFPRFTLERAPSAELAHGQVDPFDYARIDPAVEALAAGRPLPDALDAAERERLERLFHRAEHKRAQAGIVLRVSAHAFGPARMVPVSRARG